MPSESVSSRSFRALSWVAAGAVGKVGVQFIVQVTLARILGPEAFGLFAVLIAVLAIGFILADGGFGSALIQKPEIVPEDVGFALGWTLLFAGLLAIGIAASAQFLASQFGNSSLEPMFWVVSVLVIVMAMRNLSANLLRRDLRYKSLQIIDFIGYSIFFGGVSIPLALLGWGAWSLVVGFTMQAIFAMTATYWVCRHSLRPRLGGNKGMIAFGLKALVNDLATWSTDNLDRFIIGKFWGMHLLGLYSVAANLTKAPLALIVPAAQSIAFASTARLQEDLISVRKGFSSALTAAALSTFPLFALVAIESRCILSIVYGDKWLNAAPLLTALAIGIPFFSLGTIIGAFLRGLGDVGVELRIQLATAAGLFVGLITFSGGTLNFAALVISIVYIVRFGLLLLAVRRRLKMHWSTIAESVRGACLLTGIGLCTTMLAGALLRSVAHGHAVLPLLIGVATIILAFSFSSSWCLGPSLSQVLRSRFSTGRTGILIGKLTSEKV